MRFTKNLLLSVAAVLLVTTFNSQLQSAEDESESLFDGESLGQWDGDPRFWSVEDGAIVGRTSEENMPSQNTFLVYRGKEFGDFELKFSYQVKGFNSGVQYRSVDEGNWVVNGYQADFEAPCHEVDGKMIDQYSGMFFEEKGRMFLAQRGEAVIVSASETDSQKPAIRKIGSLGDRAELEKVILRDDWNEYLILANDFHFTHAINGQVMAFGIDRDRQNRRAKGIIAFQLHQGPPMEIRIKDIEIRELNKEP